MKEKVIYYRSCKDCNVSYIGQIKHHLKTKNIKMILGNTLSFCSYHMLAIICYKTIILIGLIQKFYIVKNTREREIVEMSFIKNHTST